MAERKKILLTGCTGGLIKESPGHSVEIVLSFENRSDADAAFLFLQGSPERSIDEAAFEDMSEAAPDLNSLSFGHALSEAEVRGLAKTERADQSDQSEQERIEQAKSHADENAILKNNPEDDAKVKEARSNDESKEAP
jgi:hypothetical protein